MVKLIAFFDHKLCILIQFALFYVAALIDTVLWAPVFYGFAFLTGVDPDRLMQGKAFLNNPNLNAFLIIVFFCAFIPLFVWTLVKLQRLVFGTTETEDWRVSIA